MESDVVEQQEALQPLSHSEAVERVRNAHGARRQARTIAEQCRDLYHSEPWSADDLRLFSARGMSPSNYNYVERSVNFLMGLEQSRRTEPKAYPQGPQDVAAAEICTDILRAETHRMDFDRMRSRVFRDLLIEDVCGVFAMVEPSVDGQRMENEFKRIPPEDLLYDPASRELDFSDADWMAIGRYYTKDAALKTFGNSPEAQSAIEAACNNNGSELADPEAMSDNQLRWYDTKQKRVFVVTMFYQLQNEWLYKVFTSAGDIENQVSPFADQYGRTRCPIIARSLYIDRRGVRHGRVKSMIQPQLEVNKAMSKILWLMSTKQLRASRALKGDAEEIQEQAVRPDGIIFADADEVEILNHTQDIAHHSARLEANIQFLDVQGPNKALRGRGVENQSGRAIQAQQQSGLMEESEPNDVLRDMTLDGYRAIWMNVQQFWNEERAVLVTEREDAPQFLTVNRQQIDPMTGEMMVENPVAEMSVDVRVDVGPDSITVKAEERDQLIQLLQVYGPENVPFAVAMEFFELTSERKKAIKDGLSGGDDPQAQEMKLMQAQMAQMAAKLELQAAQLDNVKTQAEIRKLNADAAETEAEISGQHPGQLMEAVKIRDQRGKQSQRAAAA